MVELKSALNSHLIPGHFGAEGSSGISLSEVANFAHLQLAAWPETCAHVGALAAGTAGCTSVPAPGQVMHGAEGVLMRVEPLKYWVICEGDGPDLAEIPTDHGAALDLSHSRVWLRLSGANAPTLLNHYLPLDLRDDAFPDGAVASSAIHHVGVTLWRSGDVYNLLIPRSFAATLYELLQGSALQYGLEVA